MSNHSSDLLSRYRTASVEYGNAQARFDADATNSAHDELITVLLAIRKANESKLDLLRPLLDDEEESVQMSAAWHLLWEDEKAATVLKSIADSGGRYSFDAKMTLRERKQGKLKPPWEWRT